jgi:uncharacterized protein
LTRRGTGIALLACLLLPAAAASAQSDLARERAEYLHWLATAPTSPTAALAQQPIGRGLRLGPADADLPLEGAPEYRVDPRPGGVRLTGLSGTRIMRRGIPIAIGRYTVTADGPSGREVLTVFGPSRSKKRPSYYQPSPADVFVGPLIPPDHHGTTRVLGLDGIEVEAAEAGRVLVPVAGRRVRLLVRRLPLAGGDESELEIFFRDETNGRGTYPAGRFVVLVPAGPGRYRLDFNRARNPFCAYSSAYPCPAPWRGNAIPAPITAGERYEGGGLAAPAESSQQ